MGTRPGAWLVAALLIRDPDDYRIELIESNPSDD